MRGSFLVSENNITQLIWIKGYFKCYDCNTNKW